MPKKNNRIPDAILENLKPISGSKIRKIRTHAKFSQAVFSSYFNRKRRYISRLERGVTKPKGSALVLLNVIRRKGFEAIL